MYTVLMYIICKPLLVQSIISCTSKKENITKIRRLIENPA